LVLKPELFEPLLEGEVKKFKLDDEVTRCSLVGVESCVQLKRFEKKRTSGAWFPSARVRAAIINYSVLAIFTDYIM